ncbi:amino acid permease [Bacillota bacterium LX-D]|nr:amino acid permease [Bacillota bacterium LX-D]
MATGNQELQRGLKERHIQMIALGGAIGTGLFYGSATTIQLVGPAITISYIIGGIIIFLIMRALGEMSVDYPVAGSFSFYAYQNVGNFAGFFSGWNYWFNYIVVCMAEITAIGAYINFWYPGVPGWISALVALVLLTAVNLANVKAYGEFEFWFAIIKVVTIIAMIIAGLLLIFLGIGNNGQPLGFANLWAHGGFLPNGILGLLFSLVVVMFSFGGVELIGITAGEAENPQKSIPSAINKVVYRILLFYVGALTVMMIIYPWNQIGTQGSPFVEIFSKIGIPAAASIINAVVITAALSAFNSGLYSNGRMLYNLAQQGNAPEALGRVSKNGAPSIGILFSAGLILISVILNYLFPGKVFLYLISVATIAGILNWTMILLTQIKFRQNRSPEEIEKLHFKMPLFPISNYISLAFLAMVVVIMAFMPDMVYALYVAPIWFLILYIGYRIQLNYKAKTPVGD